jgi:DNA-binding response OmpR family regulator
MTEKLLIADDEIDLLGELRPLLERSGYEVLTAKNGAQALAVISSEQPSLVILDVLMPVMDGRETLRRLRQQGNWTPVILLTQVNTATERVLSLQEGADDYLSKPFDPLELLARIQAVLRRTKTGTSSLANSRWLVCETLQVDRQSRQATLDGKSVFLTGRAFELLVFLMVNPMEVIPRERLLDEIWGWSYPVSTRAVDIRIAEIRKVLKDDANDPRWVETVIGLGYRFLRKVKAPNEKGESDQLSVGVGDFKSVHSGVGDSRGDGAWVAVQSRKNPRFSV